MKNRPTVMALQRSFKKKSKERKKERIGADLQHITLGLHGGLRRGRFVIGRGTLLEGLLFRFCLDCSMRE